MRQITHYLFPLALVVSLVLAVSGCATTGDPNTVSYPNGTYKLYGDGGTTPYYWVWIPNDASAPPAPPAPPAVPAKAAVVVQPAPPTTTVVVPVQPAAPTPTIVAASNGRYQLYGDGATTPYYWVWIPSGAASPPPPPPPIPRR